MSRWDDGNHSQRLVPKDRVIAVLRSNAQDLPCPSPSLLCPVAPSVGHPISPCIFCVICFGQIRVKCGREKKRHKTGRKSRTKTKNVTSADHSFQSVACFLVKRGGFSSSYRELLICVRRQFQAEGAVSGNLATGHSYTQDSPHGM